ncbi:MAG: flagellar hook-associated protein FlgK [Desulfobacterales bacterium]|nr:MAG: flagellar hook-associated protein FlgK [Desulfobacterales bacterium]
MTDIGGILSLGSQALLTQKKAIHVTGHNVANVNTPGYSRQRVQLETNPPLLMNIGPMGSGVRATEVERVYERFLGAQISNENQSLGRWEAQKSALERVEVAFNEVGGYGLSQALGEYWEAWQDLSNNPSGQTERVVLVAKGEYVASTFNQRDADLKEAQLEIDAGIQETVAEINRLAAKIADLNQKIAETETAGHPANDHRDQRDLAVKEMAFLIDIDTFEDGNGRVTVAVNGGQTLVESNRYANLSTQINAAGLRDILWVDGDGGTVNISSQIAGGKLKGWLEVRDVVIEDYAARLNGLAQTFITEVNGLHASGFGLDALNPTGNDFFTGTDAADIEVNPGIVSDNNLIAASSTLAGVPGDNSNAIAIANLQHSLTMNGNTATFGSYYHSLVSEVGHKVQEAGSYYDHQAEMMVYLDNRRESVSGVSLDEEMANLVKFQSAYDAAAKLITTADELMQTLLNML